MIPKMFISGNMENVIVHHGVVEEILNSIGKSYSLQALAKKLREALESVREMDMRCSWLS